MVTIALSLLLNQELRHGVVFGILGGVVAAGVWYMLYRATSKYRPD